MDPFQILGRGRRKIRIDKMGADIIQVQLIINNLKPFG